MSRSQGDGKIGDPVTAGQQPGEDAGMRSVGDRAGGKCLAKPNAVIGQAIERRRLNGLVTVAVDVVGAQRVNGDQKNFRLHGQGGTNLFRSGSWSLANRL